jgi:preprotein translocase subunit SecG
MVYLLTTIHVIVCVFLAVVVLLQSGKAADLAGAFGGMGSQTVFGPRGSATVLSKATTIAAALFMVTSLSLSIISTRAGKGSTPTIFDKNVKTNAPAQPAPAPAQPGQNVPITVTPTVGGQKGETKTIQVPVQTKLPDKPAELAEPATAQPSQQKK